MAATPLLIRNAELLDGRTIDVRITQGRIVATGQLAAIAGELQVEADGGLLIPGLHDHHLHLAATAAARHSVNCGPPAVTSAEALAIHLSQPGQDWLRGIGYHESVAGLLDRHWLDRISPDRPLRIQHRGGRMWFFNSAGMDALLASGLPPPPGLDIAAGRLFDADGWLRQALGSKPPALTRLGHALAAMGVTGLTDMTPENGRVTQRWLASEALPQQVIVAGDASLADLRWCDDLRLGPVKIHLHEADLLPFEILAATIRAAHASDRGVAVHCVTEAELAYALAALQAAGIHHADRIEHASVVSGPALDQLATLGLPVAVQPLFVHARGDRYLHDLPSRDWPCLYRLRSFLDAGVRLAGSSDAPYVDIDPWHAMQAAVERRTRAGQPFGPIEALTPEQALDLYLADPLDLRQTRTIALHAPADLCLLDRPWRQARTMLSADRVRLTLRAGRIIHQRIDQSPAQRSAG